MVFPHRRRRRHQWFLLLFSSVEILGSRLKAQGLFCEYRYIYISPLRPSNYQKYCPVVTVSVNYCWNGMSTQMTESIISPTRPIVMKMFPFNSDSTFWWRYFVHWPSPVVSEYDHGGLCLFSLQGLRVSCGLSDEREKKEAFPFADFHWIRVLFLFRQ